MDESTDMHDGHGDIQNARRNASPPASQPANQTDRQAGSQAGRQAGSQTDGQPAIQTGQTARQPDSQTRCRSPEIHEYRELNGMGWELSLIQISEPTRLRSRQ